MKEDQPGPELLNRPPKYPLSLAKIAELDNQFTYHSPKGDQPERYILIREKAKELARVILESTPSSRHQSLAMTKLEEVVMRANQAIAVNE